MSSRVKYLFKNVGILTISSFATKILGFLLVPLYTSVLTTSDYGIYDLITSTIALLFPIFSMNIVDGVMRFCMDKNYEQGNVAKVGIKYIVLNVIFVSFFITIIKLFNIIPAISEYIPLIYIMYFLSSFNTYFIQLAKGMEKVKDLGIMGFISSVVTIGLNILFLVTLKLGIKGFFLTNIIGQLVACSYYFIRLRFWKLIKTEDISFVNKDLEKNMLKYSLPLITTTIGWWVNGASDKYVVTLFCGVAANGILSVAYKIPNIINTLESIFISAWQISAIKEYDTENVSNFYVRLFLIFNTLLSFACTCLIILSKPFARILFRNEFYEAWQYCPFLLISTVLNAASGFIGPILSAKKDSKTLALSALIGAGANIIMNFIFVYFIGVQGAAIATAISSFIIFYVRKIKVRDELPVKRFWTVLVTWIILAGQSLIEIYTKFWYMEIICIIMIIILNLPVLKDCIVYIRMKKSGN